jgi:alpha-tubulin suppressor-like RCC1 family protein
VGKSHTCAITLEGSVKCWGDNTIGQLGDGTMIGRSTPTDVNALGGEAVAIAAGGFHTCAVLANGAARCWGANNDYQLGDGTRIGRSIPTGVGGLASGVAVIAGGQDHTCASLRDGSARCWGYNERGQLGDGTMTDRSTPVVVDGLAGAAGIVAGGAHTCALTSGGNVRCWGDNRAGQLGFDPGWVPVDVDGFGPIPNPLYLPLSMQ